jgi:hypothetical protein
MSLKNRGAAAATAALLLVGTACSLPDSRSNTVDDMPQVVSTSIAQPPAVTTSTTQTLSLPEVGNSETTLGTISWYNLTDFSLGGTRFRFDGTYYAESGGTWWSSADGLKWTRMPNVPSALPLDAGWLTGVFEHDGDTLATIRRPSDEQSELGLLRWDGDRWVEMPFKMPAPPEGVVFAADTDPVAHAGSQYLQQTYISTPTQVVISDGELMTVARAGKSSGVVLLGQVAYAVSVDGEQGRVNSLHLWRSMDGLSWEEVPVDFGSAVDEGWWGSAYVYLTGGHARLMLTIGTAHDTDAQVVLTSTDGSNWSPVAGADGSALAVPQPTDFGWMQMTLGPMYESDGWYNPRSLGVRISDDGDEWERLTIPGHRWSGGGPPLPVSYRGGLFVWSGVARLTGRQDIQVGVPTD